MADPDRDTDQDPLPRSPRSLRVPAAIPVRLYDGRQLVDAELRNLSIGGAFVAVDPPIPTGIGLSFWVGLGDGEPVLLRGHVRWTRSLRGPGGEPVGIGIQLFETDEPTVARLEAWTRGHDG